MTAVVLRDRLVTLGISGGAVMGLINIFATFFTIKNPDLKTYFVRTTIKFLVIILIFYVLLKFNANVIAVLGGFAVPLFFMCIEAIRCRLSKKQ